MDRRKERKNTFDYVIARATMWAYLGGRIGHHVHIVAEYVTQTRKTEKDETWNK